MSGREGTAPGATANLGDLRDAVDAALSELREGRVVERMREGEHTVWSPEPEEVANRLGWLRSPELMREALPEVLGLAGAVRDEDHEHAVLLGMGGSSLAPEVFREVLGVKKGYPGLTILDSTDPEALLGCAQDLGDRQALLDAERRVIRLHLGSDVTGNLDRLVGGL